MNDEVTNHTIATIERRTRAAKEGLAIHAWLRAIDQVVRQHWPVMPVPVDLSTIEDEKAVRLLVNPQAMRELIEEMVSLKRKHIFQLDPGETMIVEGIIAQLQRFLPVEQPA